MRECCLALAMQLRSPENAIGIAMAAPLPPKQQGRTPGIRGFSIPGCGFFPRTREVGSTGREQPASIAGIRQVASGCDATCDAISTDRIELLAHAERGAGMSAEVDASTGAPTHR